MSGLAGEAEGDSVTADRLRGEEQYFPDCRPFLHDGQTPHHLILLTTVTPFRAEGAGGSSTEIDATTTLAGVALSTDDELLVVVEDGFCEVPYTGVRGILMDSERIELHATGSRTYKLNVATSADEREVDAAVDYLRRKIRAVAG